jgi:hypothetical protein
MNPPLNFNQAQFDEWLQAMKDHTEALCTMREECMKCGGHNPPRTITDPLTGETKVANLCEKCSATVGGALRACLAARKEAKAAGRPLPNLSEFLK